MGKPEKEVFHSFHSIVDSKVAHSILGYRYIFGIECDAGHTHSNCLLLKDSVGRIIVVGRVVICIEELHLQFILCGHILHHSIHLGCIAPIYGHVYASSKAGSTIHSLKSDNGCIGSAHTYLQIVISLSFIEEDRCLFFSLKVCFGIYFIFPHLY